MWVIKIATLNLSHCILTVDESQPSGAQRCLHCTLFAGLEHDRDNALHLQLPEWIFGSTHSVTCECSYILSFVRGWDCQRGDVMCKCRCMYRLYMLCTMQV